MLTVSELKLGKALDMHVAMHYCNFCNLHTCDCWIACFLLIDNGCALTVLCDECGFVDSKVTYFVFLEFNICWIPAGSGWKGSC